MPASLAKRTFEALAQFLLALCVCVFLPAWSLDYWQGWLFLGLFSGATLSISVYFLKNDPALIERRLKAGAAAETEKSQKAIQTVAGLLFILLVAFPGIDHRYGWSAVPPLVAILGDGLMALGFLVVFLVFRENSYTSGVIEVARGQEVISSGPYRLVRHPMYAGSLLMTLGIPLALASFWGVSIWLPFAAAIVWRLIGEEKYLSLHLPGYAAYCANVRYRLVPGVY